MTNYEKIAQICSLIHTSDFIFLFVRRIFLRLVPCVQLAEHKKGACQDSLTVLRSQRHYFSWREKILVKTRQLSRDYSATFSPGGKSSWSRLPSCTAITVPLFAWREKKKYACQDSLAVPRSQRHCFAWREKRKLSCDHSATISSGGRKERWAVKTRQLSRDHSATISPGGRKERRMVKTRQLSTITAPQFRLA